jgi:hypothetical protein
MAQVHGLQPGHAGVTAAALVGGRLDGGPGLRPRFRKDRLLSPMDVLAGSAVDGAEQSDA